MQQQPNQGPDFRQLAEDLMSMVAALRAAYSLHTQDHPDDSVRILTLNVSEAIIHRARKELYGVDPE